MHHLRGNAIPTGHVQNPLSDSYKINLGKGVLGQHPSIVALETCAEVHQNRQNMHCLL